MSAAEVRGLPWCAASRDRLETGGREIYNKKAIDPVTL